MTRSYPPDDALDSPLSEDAITPRGGFMARPGLKTPPRHAVVVRGGDAPESDQIPRLRSSFPPPPPVSEPAVPSASEKVTLRAIPTPVSSRAAAISRAATPVTSSPMPVVDSVPPPSDAPSSHAPLSDAPYVSHISDAPNGPESRRPARSRWTIVFAAAAGLVLGLASVGARLQATSAAAQPQSAPTLSAPVAAPSAPTPAVAPQAPAAASSAITRPSTPAATLEGERAASERKPARPAQPSAKRSIF